MTELTDEAVKALLDGATPGAWRADGEPWNRVVWSSADNRVCFMAHSNGLNDERDTATSNLVAAAPDLARALIASEAARKLAEERLAKALVAREKIKAAYEELLATVHGECPSLINEDSGGSQVLLDLILAADEAITTIKELNE